MRKGQKQTLKELAVPKDSDMAVNLFKQEEVQRQEKEKMNARRFYIQFFMLTDDRQILHDQLNM